MTGAVSHSARFLIGQVIPISVTGTWRFRHLRISLVTERLITVKEYGENDTSTFNNFEKLPPLLCMF